MRPTGACSRCLLPQILQLAGLVSAGDECPAFVLAGSGALSSTCPSYSYLAGPDAPQPELLWARGDACQSLGSTQLCSFTNPSFNGGFGLSLITSPERLGDLLLMPSLTTQPATKRSYTGQGAAPGRLGQPYHDEVIPGKGIGLVASGPIAAGDLILARTPAVLLDEDGFGGLGAGPLQQLLVQAIGALPHEHRTQYMNLSTHDDVSSYEERVYQVFAKNNYRTRITNTSDFHAAFVDVSRLNHACRPNCGYHFDATTLTQEIFAARDILPGEELTVSYIDPIQTRDARQTQLRSSWGFECTCELCTAETHDLAESDGNIRRIQSLWRELDDYTGTSNATPDKAEELLSLYELERLKTRIHEAYYRAAIEWNGVGNSSKAVEYGKLSISQGRVMTGLEKPYIANMQALVDGPEGHWTWKFRLA